MRQRTQFMKDSPFVRFEMEKLYLTNKKLKVDNQPLLPILPNNIDYNNFGKLLSRLLNSTRTWQLVTAVGLIYFVYRTNYHRLME